MDNLNDSVKDIYRLAVMWAASAINTLFGGTDGIFLTLIIFMTVDYITGFCAAIVNKQVSSRIGAKGIAKKAGILCVVALATLIEKNVIDTTALRTAVILYYISNEGISIFENITRLGVPVPKKMKDLLNHLTDENAQ